MQADQLIKGEELNCMRAKRCVHQAFCVLGADSSFSATIDRFLAWLAEATNAGLRQMCARFLKHICIRLSSHFTCRSAAIGLDVAPPVAVKADCEMAQSMIEA